MLERNIDDYQNVDGDRELSETWTGFAKFTILNEKPPDGYMVLGETDKKANELQTRLFKARNLDRFVRSVEAKRKAKVYTRTQCTGPIWELLTRRDWRSIKRDLTRSSFTTLYQQRVLRRWWPWVQEKCSPRKVVLEPAWHEGRTDTTSIEERASHARSSKYGKLVAVKAIIGFKDYHTLQVNKKTKHAKKWSKSWFINSKRTQIEKRWKPTWGKSRVQPIQREVEGHDLQHGERRVLRNVWDSFQKFSALSVWHTERQGSCTLYLRNLLASYRQNAQVEPGSIWYTIDSTLRDKERPASWPASWEHWETTN